MYTHDVARRARHRRKLEHCRCRIEARLSGKSRLARCAVEISNEPAVSTLGVTAERDGWDQFIIAVAISTPANLFPTASGKSSSASDAAAVGNRAKQQSAPLSTHPSVGIRGCSMSWRCGAL
jgi:hypothetical protein